MLVLKKTVSPSALAIKQNMDLINNSLHVIIMCFAFEAWCIGDSCELFEVG